MESQIKATFYRAFFDSIRENVNSDTPDYEWLVRLFVEIRDRLTKFVRKDSKTAKSIEDSFDVDLFRQMITNEVFDANSMSKLVDTTFYWIKQLQAPVHDEDIEKSKKLVYSSKPETMIACFIREVHICLDKLEDDMIKYFSSK